jgi:alkylhydroperoxidase/carboxymuconolactone decarboxylase family protein YurZ
MYRDTSGMSEAFQTFIKEAPDHAKAYLAAAQGLHGASDLDAKTEHLAYLAVLAAMRLSSGVPFHVSLAKHAGATRAEIISAILVGLPAAGVGVTAALPAALEAYDAAK